MAIKNLKRFRPTSEIRPKSINNRDPETIVGQTRISGAFHRLKKEESMPNFSRVRFGLRRRITVRFVQTRRSEKIAMAEGISTARLCLNSSGFAMPGKDRCH